MKIGDLIVDREGQLGIILTEPRLVTAIADLLQRFGQRGT